MNIREVVMRYYFVVFLAKKKKAGYPELLSHLMSPSHESVTANSFVEFSGPFVENQFVAAVEAEGLQEVCVTFFSEVDEETFRANRS
jgi:hypothetical protein